MRPPSCARRRTTLTQASRCCKCKPRRAMAVAFGAATAREPLDREGLTSVSGAALQETFLDVLNPKAVNIGELYGEYNALTSEWSDGLASKLVRKAIGDHTEHRRLCSRLGSAKVAAALGGHASAAHPLTNPSFGPLQVDCLRWASGCLVDREHEHGPGRHVHALPSEWYVLSHHGCHSRRSCCVCSPSCLCRIGRHMDSDVRMFCRRENQAQPHYHEAPV